jgi:hypothetical protein
MKIKNNLTRNRILEIMKSLIQNNKKIKLVNKI